MIYLMDRTVVRSSPNDVGRAIGLVGDLLEHSDVVVQIGA
jgi:hypothetical protein